MGGLPADRGFLAEEAQRAVSTWCLKPLVVHDIRVLAEALWSVYQVETDGAKGK